MSGEITALRQGAATKFTVLIDGEEAEFKLAVVARRGFREERFEFAYVCEERGLLAAGCYSGGLTGVGCDRFEEFSRDALTGDADDPRFRLVTTSLVKIMAMGAEADCARADEKRRLETAIAAAVREINALPVEYDVAVTEDGCRVFVERTEAKYDPRTAKWQPFVYVRKQCGKGAAAADVHACFGGLDVYRLAAEMVDCVKAKIHEITRSHGAYPKE